MVKFNVQPPCGALLRVRQFMDTACPLDLAGARNSDRSRMHSFTLEAPLQAGVSGIEGIRESKYLL